MERQDTRPTPPDGDWVHGRRRRRLRGEPPVVGWFIDQLAGDARVLSLVAMLVLIGHLLRHIKSSRSSTWLWTGFALALLAVGPLGGAFEGL